MIEKIIIKNTTSCFDSKGIELINLMMNNYIYGSNGTGKTTISRVINDCQNYNSCNLVWKNNNELETVVYNKDFIDENFYRSSEIKGVFTLGKNSHEIQDTIKIKKEHIERIEENLREIDKKLEKEKSEKMKVDKKYQSACWDLKLKYDKDFKETFIGFRISKEKFKEKCIKEANNGSMLKFYDELTDQYNMIFGKHQFNITSIEKINFNDLYKIMSSSILTSNIIGSGDIEIGKLIKLLNNTDWVKDGYEYYKKTNDICPFCQKDTDEYLKIQLESYFDEDYTSKVNNVKIIEKRYNGKATLF